MAGLRVIGLLLTFASVLIRNGQAQSGLPTPEATLGFRVGDDFRLASYDESLAYFRQLADASDRVQLVEVGQTSDGKAWYVALISSPDNLANVERHRDIAVRLAHPGGLTDAQARSLAQEGRALVHIDGGLHATEVAHAQHTIQLAYDLASEQNDEEVLSILDNVILMLWPSINPDGQNMVVEWYRQNLGTPFEVAPLPRLYQKYIGHDNNRDGYMINMIESRVVTRVLRQWEPQILYNHHQTAPFPARIWIPPFAEPISDFVHPLMWRTVNLIGMAMAHGLEERGQTGAVHMGTGFDNWYPGFMDHANNFHNMAALLTETGLYRYATPHFYTIGDFPAPRRDLRPQSLYASPWEGGWWRLRDAVDYMLTASMTVLDVAAKYKTDVLYNRYQAGRDIIDFHRNNPPFAYFVPQDQHDPVAAVELLRRLAFNGIDIHQLSAAVSFQGQQLGAGTWVIPMDQPFANFVKQLFDVQDYPDIREFPEGPPDQPYDVAGWTLPYQMGVRVIAAAQPLTAELQNALRPVRAAAVPWNTSVADAAPFDTPAGVGFDSDSVAAGILPRPGSINGSGPALNVDVAQNNAFRLLNRAWDAGANVRFVPGVVGDSGEAGSTGRYQITDLNQDSAARFVRELAVTATRGPQQGNPVERPRIGLYRPWNASIDEGWTRWLMERFGFRVTSVYNPDVLAGDLQSRYDVLILPDLSADQIVDGFRKGSVPPRYAGGLGRPGVRELDTFVRSGGTLVSLNQSSLFAIEQLHLPVQNVIADRPREEFFMSGSILEMAVDPSHPVMTGMPSPAAIFASRSPVFTVTEEFIGRAIATYAKDGSPLMSGYLLGEEHLQGFAAALEVHHGTGRVLLLGMRPQWRGQPFGSFRILFNAALYGRSLASVTADDGRFWTRPMPTDSTQQSERQGNRD